MIFYFFFLVEEGGVGGVAAIDVLFVSLFLSSNLLSKGTVKVASGEEWTFFWAA